MKQFIRHAIRICLFVAILYGLMAALSPIFIPKENSKEAGMDFAQANGILAEPADTIDCVIVGDSEAYNAFSPMEMWDTNGITSYLSATGAQQIYDTTMYIEQALIAQHPNVVIIETNLLYRKAGFPTFFDTMLQRMSPLLRYHDRWKTLSLIDVHKAGEKTAYTWTDDLKGFRYFPKTKGIEVGQYMIPTEEASNFNRLSRLYLKEIESLCEKYGAKLLFVSTPSTKNWNYKRHNGVQKYADANSIGYLDMNLLPEDEFQINWKKDTKDKGDHLNYRGAKKASAYLAQYLQDNYGLEDHREDPDYAFWFDTLKRYRAYIKEEKKKQ